LQLSRLLANSACNRRLAVAAPKKLMNTISHRSPSNTLANLWSLAGLPPDAVAHAALTGADPVLPSSFPVGTAAQASLAAAALATCELAHARGQAGLSFIRLAFNL